MPRTDSASLVVAAQPERVYAALTDPDALVEWLPPGDMTARFEWFELRPGGSYRLVLTYADGSGARGKATADTDVVDARFVELVPSIRVSQDVDFESDDAAFHGTMRMTWHIAPTADGTRVDVVAEDVPEGISAEDHAEDLAASLANLSRHLAP